MSSFDSAEDIFEDKFVEMSSYTKELMFSLDRHPSFANDSFWVSELYKRKECVCVCVSQGWGWWDKPEFDILCHYHAGVDHRIRNF